MENIHNTPKATINPLSRNTTPVNSAKEPVNLLVTPDDKPIELKEQNAPVKKNKYKTFTISDLKK